MSTIDPPESALEPADVQVSAMEPGGSPDEHPAGERTRRRRRADRRARRKIVIVLAVLVALLLLPVVAVATWVYLQLDPWGPQGDRVVVTVQPGWGTSQIGDELADAGVIGSSLVFRVWEREAQFTAGTYELRENMGVLDAASEMTAGPDATPEVGVLPGLTLDEIGDRVAGIRRFSKERFLTLATNGGIRSVFEPVGTDTLEGLLWPSSYQVLPDQTEKGLLAEMVTAFDDDATRLGLVEAAGTLDRTPYEVITVASLVQREAKLDEDRPLIAAVIYNRLADGMPLQIDATTQYAQQVGDPSYDTYEIPALPPTPISTVSRSSLEAAMNPADVPYRYYVLSDANGKHVFSETYDEHLANVEAARAKGLL